MAEGVIVGRLALEKLIYEDLCSAGQEADRRFLAAVQSALDLVISTSPSYLPPLLETLAPRFRDEEVLLVLGKTFLRRQMHKEAEYFLRKLLTEVNPDCLVARESLRMMYEMIIPRWHFHMLNDFVRNSSYARAISEAVACIPDCSVLDIGSGTGLLSMLAVRSGASQVYACEMDTTMATMSRDIIAANGMTDEISVINKISTDLTIPQELPERVCLVVTETVDAGLLGEAVVKTIRDAWSRLLLPRQPAGSTNRIVRCGHVIPCGATLYVMAIESPYISRHSRLVSDVVGGLSFCGLSLEGSCKGSSDRVGGGGRETEGAQRSCGQEGGDGGGLRGGGESVFVGRCEERGGSDGLAREWYTCERLSCISGGYSELSKVHRALSLDFTDPEVPLPSVNLALPVVRAGCLDAVATYYDLHLDSSVTISTSPYGNQNCSWEQAVYPLTATADEGGMKSIRVEEGDIVHIKAACTDSLLHVTVERIERNSTDKEDMGCPVSGSSTAKEDMGCPVSGSSTAKEDMGCPVSGSSTAKEDMGCPVSGSSIAQEDMGCPVSGSSTAKEDMGCPVSGSSTAKEDMGCPVSGSSIAQEDMACPISGSSTAKEDMGCPISGSSTAKEDMGCPVSGLSTGTEDMACSISGLSAGKGDVDCPISESSTVHFVDRGAMCRLNDAAYHEVYSSAIAHTLRLLQDSESESDSSDIISDSNPDPTAGVGAEPSDCDTKAEDELSTEFEDIARITALDLSHELSVLGLIAANIGVDFVQVGRCQDIYTSLLETVAGNNGLQNKTSIKWVELEKTFKPLPLLWDIVLCDVVSPQGILRPAVFEEIGAVRECQSHSDTVILPSWVTVHSVAISSPDLRAQTTVLGSVPTLGLDIAHFINKYQVTHCIDLDLSSLPHERLTEETELFSIDLNSLSITPFKEEREVSLEVTRTGSLTGFVYWFSLHFPTGATISTGISQGQLQSHWHQAVFCLQEEVAVQKGQKLSLRALIADSLLDISLSNCDSH